LIFASSALVLGEFEAGRTPWIASTCVRQFCHRKQPESGLARLSQHGRQVPVVIDELDRSVSIEDFDRERDAISQVAVVLELSIEG
jgi:hypothetical protein